MSDILLSLTMLAALALIVGAFVLWRRKGEGRKALLMVVAALVVLANVAIWSLPAPTSTGQRP